MSSSANNNGAGTNRRRRRPRSAMADLQFPVSRVAKFLKKGRYCRRLGATAPVYLAAILENLVVEVLELSAKVTRDKFKKTIIKPRHIMLAVRQEVELNKLFHGVTISTAGVVPKVRKELNPRKAGSTRRGD
uniref:Histone H2A n=1 Tax=Lilium davidii var. unicolor TaxID=1473204 RepID=A0A0U5KQV4_LILDA|nr:gH2A.1 [Lilium davidii var. unicolor]